MFRNELVDREAQLLATEAGELGEQRRGVDLEHEAPPGAADDLAVWAQRRAQQAVERVVVGAAMLLLAGLPQDVAQEVTDGSGFGHLDRRRAMRWTHGAVGAADRAPRIKHH